MNDATDDDAQQPARGASGETPQVTESDMERPLPRSIRVYIVDDHPVVRKGLRMLLDLQPDLQVCGDAVGVSTAREGIPTKHPDLVIVDLGLEDGDGFELMEWLRRDQPQATMLVFTGQEDPAFVERAFRCGALGYVAKQDGTRELVRAIRLVMREQRFISNRVQDKGRQAGRAGTKT
jgi:DNA-binding NarL/FixJ family response regulator